MIVQCPLSEYDFKITNLFVDIQDGVRLCRAIQLLLNDYSILTVVSFFIQEKICLNSFFFFFFSFLNFVIILLSENYCSIRYSKEELGKLWQGCAVS